MFSYVCAAIASFHNAQAVLIAAGITALVTLSVSLFAVQTKIDFTMCYGLIFAACMTLFFLAIAFIIVYAAIPPGENGKNYYVSDNPIFCQMYHKINKMGITTLWYNFSLQNVINPNKRTYSLHISKLHLYMRQPNIVRPSEVMKWKPFWNFVSKLLNWKTTPCLLSISNSLTKFFCFSFVSLWV